MFNLLSSWMDFRSVLGPFGEMALKGHPGPARRVLISNVDYKDELGSNQYTCVYTTERFSWMNMRLQRT